MPASATQGANDSIFDARATRCAPDYRGAASRTGKHPARTRSWRPEEGYRADAQLALSALATLPTGSARAGAEALIELADRYRLQRVDELLTAWVETHGFGK